jgi:hypothetical protein
MPAPSDRDPLVSLRQSAVSPVAAAIASAVLVVGATVAFGLTSPARGAGRGAVTTVPTSPPAPTDPGSTIPSPPPPATPLPRPDPAPTHTPPAAQTRSPAAVEPPTPPAPTPRTQTRAAVTPVAPPPAPPAVRTQPAMHAPAVRAAPPPAKTQPKPGRRRPASSASSPLRRAVPIAAASDGSSPKTLVVVTLILAILLFGIAATPARVVPSRPLAWALATNAAAINLAALFLLCAAAIEYVVVRVAL